FRFYCVGFSTHRECLRCPNSRSHCRLHYSSDQGIFYIETPCPRCRRASRKCARASRRRGTERLGRTPKIVLLRIFALSDVLLWLRRVRFQNITCPKTLTSSSEIVGDAQRQSDVLDFTR